MSTNLTLDLKTEADLATLKLTTTAVAIHQIRVATAKGDPVAETHLVQAVAARDEAENRLRARIKELERMSIIKDAMMRETRFNEGRNASLDSYFDDIEVVDEERRIRQAIAMMMYHEETEQS